MDEAALLETAMAPPKAQRALARQGAGATFYSLPLEGTSRVAAARPAGQSLGLQVVS